MLRLRRYIAPIVLASCLIAGATLRPAMALIDRGEPPVVVGTIILDSMRNAGHDSGHDWGWVGLLGLTGLAGLAGKGCWASRALTMSGREQRLRAGSTR